MDLPNAIYLDLSDKRKAPVKVPFIRELKKELKPKLGKRYVLFDSLTGKELSSWFEEE